MFNGYSKSQKGLGKCSTNSKRPQVPAQTTTPEKLSNTTDGDKKTFHDETKFK